MLNSAASVSFSLDEQWPDRLLIWHVRPREAHQRLHLPLPRRDRARGRPRQTAHHQEPGPQGGPRDLRHPGAPGQLRRPLRRAGRGALATRDRQSAGLACTRIGAPLLFGWLWEETGCRAVMEDLLAERRFEVPLERPVFATVA